MADEKNIGGILLAFLAGTAVGGALALLFAPSSGAETRRKIKATSLETKEKAMGKVEDVKSEAAEIVGRGKEKVAGVKLEAAEVVERGKEKVAGVKSQIHAAMEAGKGAYTRKKGELVPEEEKVKEEE